ncbi:PLP-dependent aminotransferase family protein [Enterorhabdus sp. P55]|nr:PLP-dependent aminotransferase family protein [Enterorhabdus sp. P55]NBI32700.1 PLP-dependent aminotransferase family protein [Enterorhabdus sp. P55]
MLTYELRREGAGTLQGQLYAFIRADVESGVIAAGERLPSRRALARHLGVSVITVEGAYGQLVAEGYLESRERRGFFAADIPRAPAYGVVGVGAQCSSGVPVKPLSDAVPAAGSTAGGGANASAARSASLEAHGGSGSGGAKKGKNTLLTCTDGASRAISSIENITFSSPAPSRAFAAGFSGPAPSRGPEAGFSSPAPSRELVADFSGATAGEGLFPYAAWARTIRRVLADESERTLLAASGPRGSLALRRAIADHLRGFRGMVVDPAQIVVGAGAQALYHLLVLLLGRSRRFAVEDPGYPRLAATYRAEGVSVAPVALDAEGPSLSALRASGASVLHCMPSHQFPTGLVTPAPRRYELLAWAVEEPGRYLVEDDYDCEFRMAGRPLPSLQSIDGAERVIYLNTFTKSLGAAFRIGYMVLPPHLARAFARDLGFHACTVGALEQAALARFIESGDYERHVNRTRARSRRVRDALLDALRATPAADRLAFEHVDAGLHFVLHVRGMDARGQEDLVARALSRSVRMAPLASYALGSAADPSLTGRFLMAYGSVQEQNVAAAARVIGDECG